MFIVSSLSELYETATGKPASCLKFQVSRSSECFGREAIQADALDLTDKGIHFVPVFATDYDPDLGQDQGAHYIAKYLTLDIDYKPRSSESEESAITKAISTTQRYVEWYIAQGGNPEGLKIHATGKKGFHISMPLDVLLPGGASSLTKGQMQALPDIFRQAACDIAYQSGCDLGRDGGIDLALYARGQSQLLRCPGLQRANGKFKVPVSWAELQTMTPADYAAITSSARAEFQELGALVAPPKLQARWQAWVKLGLDAVENRARRLVSPGETLPGTPREIARVQSALDALDPDMNYEDWLKPGMALHQTQWDCAFEMFDKWSRKGSKFKPGCTEAKWVSFDARDAGGVTVGTLFKMAKEAGWVGPKRPTIYIALDISRMVDLALVVLADPALGVFEYAGGLIQLCQRRSKPGGAGKRGLYLSRLELPVLSEILNREIRWVKVETKAGERIETEVACPKDVPATIVARRSWPTVPVLRGLLNHPVMLDRGRVLNTTGYDPDSGFYLVGEACQRVNDHPSKADAELAIRRLREIFKEFPWADKKCDLDEPMGVDESVFITAILTLVQRPVLALAPAFLLTAPERASGKTLLLSCLGIIKLGTLSVPVQTLPGGGRADRAGDELRKRVTSLLMEGAGFVGFDEVDEVPNDPVIRAILTSEIYSDRILSTNSTVQASTNTSVFFTGNNTRICSDLVRRILVSNVDAKMERPELRSGWEIADLRGYVLEHRSQIIADALTIVKAYQVVGCPDATTIASFEDWSRSIRSAVVWLGHADPCESQNQRAEEDPERAELREVGEAWLAEVGMHNGRALSAVSLQTPLADLFFRLAPGVGGRFNARNLGRWFAHHKDRIFTLDTDKGTVRVRFTILPVRSAVAKWVLVPA